MPLKAAIAEVINFRNLSLEQAEKAMDAIMEGLASQAQIGSYLTALRMKGETIEEIAGSAKSMRAHVVPVKVPVKSYGGMLVDTVGTGGDGRPEAPEPRYVMSGVAAHFLFRRSRH